MNEAPCFDSSKSRFQGTAKGPLADRQLFTPKLERQVPGDLRLIRYGAMATKGVVGGHYPSMQYNAPRPSKVSTPTFTPMASTSLYSLPDCGIWKPALLAAASTWLRVTSNTK